MNGKYVIAGIILLLIAYSSIATDKGNEIFFQIFGMFFMIASYVIGLIGFWTIIIGLLKDSPPRHFRHQGHRRRHWR